VKLAELATVSIPPFKSDPGPRFHSSGTTLPEAITVP
jgi:hypothetical protein